MVRCLRYEKGHSIRILMYCKKKGTITTYVGLINNQINLVFVGIYILEPLTKLWNTCPGIPAFHSTSQYTNICISMQR